MTCWKLSQIYGSHRRIGHVCQGFWSGRVRTPRRRVILPVGVSVGATLCIGDLGDVSKHLEKSGIISPPGDTLILQADGSWSYPPLNTDMEEAVLEEVDTYFDRHQNIITQFISTRLVMDLCLEAERRPWTQVSQWWW